MNCLLMTLGVWLFLSVFLHLTVTCFGLFTISREAAHSTAHHEGPHCQDAAKAPFPQGPPCQTLPLPELPTSMLLTHWEPKAHWRKSYTHTHTHTHKGKQTFFTCSSHSVGPGLENNWRNRSQEHSTYSPAHASPLLRPRCLQRPVLSQDMVFS